MILAGRVLLQAPSSWLLIIRYSLCGNIKCFHDRNVPTGNRLPASEALLSPYTHSQLNKILNNYSCIQNFSYLS